MKPAACFTGIKWQDVTEAPCGNLQGDGIDTNQLLLVMSQEKGKLANQLPKISAKQGKMVQLMLVRKFWLLG